MFGAIIGDLAGSIYEFEQVKKAHSVEMQNILENDSFFSDDTILTIAILDAVLSKQGYEKKLKEYGKNMRDIYQIIHLILKQHFHQDLLSG